MMAVVVTFKLFRPGPGPGPRRTRNNHYDGPGPPGPGPGARELRSRPVTSTDGLSELECSEARRPLAVPVSTPGPARRARGVRVTESLSTVTPESPVPSRESDYCATLTTLPGRGDSAGGRW